jgi:hypothetical protein
MQHVGANRWIPAFAGMTGRLAGSANPPAGRFEACRDGKSVRPYPICYDRLKRLLYHVAAGQTPDASLIDQARSAKPAR